MVQQQYLKRKLQSSIDQLCGVGWRSMGVVVIDIKLNEQQ